MQEIGEVGTTTISFDLSDLTLTDKVVADFNLIIDSDTNFTFNAETVTATTYSSSTGIVTFNNVDLEDGEYFSLGTRMSDDAPGGIYQNLLVWLRADAGVDLNINAEDPRVEDWRDQSINGNDFGQGETFQQPILTTEAINGNPGLSFDGVNDRLEDGDGEDYLCLLYTSPSPRDRTRSRMPSSA